MNIMKSTRSTFNILFYLKRKAKKSNGNAPIMGRITVNGKSAQFSAKIEINPDLWSVEAGKASGKSLSAQEINALLESIKTTMTKIYRDLQERENHVSPQKIKNIFFGLEFDNQTILSLFDKFLADCKQLIDVGIEKTIYGKYERTKTFVVQLNCPIIFLLRNA